MTTITLAEPFEARYVRADAGAKITVNHYQDGSEALVLTGWDCYHQEPVEEVLTVNNRTGRMTVGDYSEHEGIYEELVYHGVVKTTPRRYKSGLATVSRLN